MTTPSFSPEAHETWRRLYESQRAAIRDAIHPLFGQGLCALEIGSQRIPDLGLVNRRLNDLTGFQGVFVDGHEKPVSFFPMLARGEFPIGAFIRDARDLAYTPAPDVFHDLFGHLPYLANREYADFIRKYGAFASSYADRPDLMAQLERLYWFTFEFALIRTPDGVRVFGSGIASSHSETRYALSDAPEVVPFSVEEVRKQEFRIDRFQERLFVLNSLTQLYRCLDDFV